MTYQVLSAMVVVLTTVLLISTFSLLVPSNCIFMSTEPPFLTLNSSSPSCGLTEKRIAQRVTMTVWEAGAICMR